MASLMVLISCNNKKEKDTSSDVTEEVDTDQKTDESPQSEGINKEYKDLKITDVKLIKLNNPGNSWIAHTLKVTKGNYELNYQ
ncbi:hypothetical protein [Galbibacter marinus]|nr:hypothetical protein [Galbibacter marinus]